jgi:hypothetical protein
MKCQNCQHVGTARAFLDGIELGRCLYPRPFWDTCHSLVQVDREQYCAAFSARLPSVDTIDEVPRLPKEPVVACYYGCTVAGGVTTALGTKITTTWDNSEPSDLCGGES